MGEFGDFQTPVPLAKEVLTTLKGLNIQSSRILEPTCGCGNFIRALIESKHPPKEIIGIELQGRYVAAAGKIPAPEGVRIEILKKNIFNFDLANQLPWKKQGPLLIVGNPPWITNSALGAMESTNLPSKKNLKGIRGIDAITGCSNFDLAEAIIIKVITELLKQRPLLAMLCKVSVARNVMKYLNQAALPVQEASIRKINAKQWFNAAVDACLFILDIGRLPLKYELDVFDSLQADRPSSRMGFVGNQFVSDIRTYNTLSFLDGKSPGHWRQGIKHDAASVMELIPENGQWLNMKGERVDIESDFIFPLAKGSDLSGRGEFRIKHGVIVSQKALSEDTTHLKEIAPRLWMYFKRHEDVFNSRKSSVYRNKPPFSVFGIGDYSFTPYKVLVSGFHKQFHFFPTGPQKGKPVLCDDTCYMLPCESALQAAVATALLNHPVTIQFIKSIAFLDSKRPITKAILKRIDLIALARHVSPNEIRPEIQKVFYDLSQTKLPSRNINTEDIMDSMRPSEERSQYALFT